MKIRLSKNTDQEQIQKGFDLVKELMQQHPEIEITLWAGVMWSILSDGYVASGVDYDEFKQELDKVKNHYKHWFDE